MAPRASAPLLLGLASEWLDAQLGEVSRKSPIADAIRYGLSIIGRGLPAFLEDGRIEL